MTLAGGDIFEVRRKEQHCGRLVEGVPDFGPDQAIALRRVLRSRPTSEARDRFRLYPLVDSVLTRPRRPPILTRRPGARVHDCWPPPTGSRVALPGQMRDHRTRLSRQGTFPARSGSLVLGDAARQPLAP